MSNKKLIFSQKLNINSLIFLQLQFIHFNHMRKITFTFILYFISHFFYGQYFNVLGSLVPYLSQQTHLKQQQYTYLFTLRGIGYLLAGFVQKSAFISQYDLHRRMFFACFFTGVGFTLFAFTTNTYLLGGIVFFMSIASCSIEILINVLLLLEGKEDPRFYVNLSYGIYGIGAILGPIIVSLLGLHSTILIGLCQGASGFGFLFKKSPREYESNQNEKEQTKPLNKKEEFHFCLILMLYAAITLSYRNWIPSFTVIEKIGTKEEAAYTVSIYSIMLTLFRFLLTGLNKKTSQTLVLASNGMIVIVILCLLVYAMGFKFLMVFGSAILLGMIYSTYYPYVFALPKEYNKTISSKNSSNIMIFYAIGEGILVSIVGYFMSWFPIMLFISCLLMMIVNRIIIGKSIYLLQSNAASEKELEIELIEDER